jgi:hypothetical protein
MAQQQPNPASVDVPVQLALDDVCHAYGRSPAADEVQIKVRTLTGAAERERASERADAFRVFTEPDPGQHALKRLRVELGPVTIYAGEGRITAVSASAPALYFQTEYSGPLTPAVLAERLPPIPAPQLLFAVSPDPDAPMALPPYLREIRWTSAVARPTAKPPYVTVVGSSADGPVGMVVSADSGRLVNFSAEWGRPDSPGSTTVELAVKPIPPGDPAAWSLATAGRTRVPTLDALRPASAKAAPGPADPSSTDAGAKPASAPGAESGPQRE